MGEESPTHLERRISNALRRIAVYSTYGDPAVDGGDILLRASADIDRARTAPEWENHREQAEEVIASALELLKGRELLPTGTSTLSEACQYLMPKCRGAPNTPPKNTNRSRLT